MYNFAPFKLFDIINEWYAENLEGRKCEIIEGLYKGQIGFIIIEGVRCASSGKMVVGVKRSCGIMDYINEEDIERI